MIIPAELMLITHILFVGKWQRIQQAPPIWASSHSICGYHHDMDYKWSYCFLEGTFQIRQQHKKAETHSGSCFIIYSAYCISSLGNAIALEVQGSWGKACHQDSKRVGPVIKSIKVRQQSWGFPDLQLHGNSFTLCKVKRIFYIPLIGGVQHAQKGPTELLEAWW